MRQEVKRRPGEISEHKQSATAQGKHNHGTKKDNKAWFEETRPGTFRRDAGNGASKRRSGRERRWLIPL